ncbi:MAG: glutamate---cysteine ligase / carboxylate-amine ligase [Solirubrobacteraceae bacterium]|nr:glutamate---cysteine ligase / carboxylate-amine ligase [Solirubrobacteraceae bacterium]MEA2355969.1 glutamate---cysteine ligase / carboxylate-amine ligase [Solirubrobacteraceae bacterium]
MPTPPDAVARDPLVEPDWARWDEQAASSPWTIGIEEEVMLLDPDRWALDAQIDTVLPALPDGLASHVGAETHGSALELRTGVHPSVGSGIGELRHLRRALADELQVLGLRAAAAGMHPFAVWQDTEISSGARYQMLHGSMRELARREPTFALHVHVALPDREAATRAINQMRAHVPLLLALSANSPYWQGRDTGLASARTPLFQGFPRVGIPRAFADYADYVESIDLLLRCDAFPEPTFLWWDVRLQPRFATIEVRIMDAQTELSRCAALVALVQSLVRLEVEEGFATPALVGAPEVLAENRFLAARDGVEAELIDPDAGCRIPVRDLLAGTVAACRPHAEDLGCAAELEATGAISDRPDPAWQREAAAGPDGLPGLVEALAAVF